MVTYPVMRKLASARNSASDAGLSQTAERLEILRTRLAEYKDIPERFRDKRLRWASGKLEDIRSTLRKEVSAVDEETRKEMEHRSGNGATLAKAAGFLGFAWFTFKAIDALQDHGFALIAGAVTGYTIFCSIINGLIGPISFEKSRENIENALSQCAKAIGRHRDSLRLASPKQQAEF
jgi:hypothetical protein